MNVDWDIVSGIAAAAATGTSLFAWYSSHKSQQRMEVIAARQDNLAHQSWADAYFRDITVWASEVCKTISSAIHTVGKENAESRQQILVSLSACIDMGRWYLPNLAGTEKGQHKEPAYRGERQPALDWIVLAYDIYHHPITFSDPHKELVKCQRNFVSAIQEIINPRSREAQMRDVLKIFRPVAAREKITSPPDAP